MSEREPRILIYSPHDVEEYRDYLLAHGSPGTIETAATPEEAEAHIADAEVLIAWRFPDHLFPQARNLRWVQSLGAGVEGLVGANLPPHVVITRVVGIFDGPIAEYVFAHLLARAQLLEQRWEMQRRHEWARVLGSTLAGKRIGVAGLGSIGREVVRKAKAFDIRVSGLSRSRPPDGLVERHFLPDQWTAFVRDLDALVLTLPLTPETEHVVNREVLSAMQPHALLVNVGRGRLIVADDLIAALREGQIGGAILDVFEHEPLPPDSPFWSLPGVTVTPHISGPSTAPEVGAFVLENVQRYARDEPLAGVVNRAAGY